MTRNQIIALKILAIVFLVALAAQAADAHEPTRERGGFFLGADLGAGGSKLKYTVDGQDYESEDILGGGMTLRLGYQFTPWFGLSIDARGAGQGTHDDHCLAIASSVIMATFYPGNGGFFIRFGVGAARVTTGLPDDYDTGTGLAREIEEDTGIAALGLGYEWMVNDHFSLGLAVDGRGGEIDDVDGLTDISFGESSFGISMNYFF